MMNYVNSDNGCSMDIPEGWKIVDKKHGKGGQASTMVVRHKDGREGVYREIRKKLSEVARMRFLRELDIFSETVEHRAIVKLFSWSTDPDKLWYISELGDSFSAWWRDRRRQYGSDPARLVDCAITAIRELSSGLAVCHDNGIVHRDLKPANIVMKRNVSNPWPILIDFGIAYDEYGNRLTQTDDAVGNARFSPDIMRRRMETVPPWIDIFDLGQLVIWLLDKKAPKSHWQRPVHWKYVVYDESIPENVQSSLRAFTAACSTPTTAPANGNESLELLEKLFPQRLQMPNGSLNPATIVQAKRRGESTRLLAAAEIEGEIEAAAPLAEKMYSVLRDVFISVINELVEYESTAKVHFDNEFSYQLIGATDLLLASVGPRSRGIQIRIKGKVVPWAEPLPWNKWNRDFWQKHMPREAICFTFALEGGVVHAGNAQYLDGRWITIGRDGTLFMHPLSAGFGNYGDNDLGGSPEGPGEITTIAEIRDFMISVLTNESYWIYIAANQEGSS